MSDQLRPDAAARTLPVWRSVLAVVAHPDDESFGLGAILDAFVQAGAAVSVLCLTKGEASTLGMSPELSKRRAVELQRAAAQLGVSSVVPLDYRDGDLDAVEHSRLASEVSRELAARPADGLVAFDIEGVTGHPDHTAATRAALDAARDADVPVLGWTLPEGVARQMNEELDAMFIGHPPSSVDLVVEVDRARQLAASREHASQALPTSVLWRRLELLGNREYLRWLRHP